MKQVIATWVGLAMLAGGAAWAGSGAHWGYSGHEGPEHWGELAPEFWACAKGRNQSPVDLAGMVEAQLPPIEFSYAATPLEVVNNGHTVQVNYAPGSRISVAGHAYELKQFHFHAPSENRVGGKSFPLEAHLVHADAEGNLAVVAVLFEEGAPNGAVETAWAAMPEHAGDKAAPAGATVDADDLLPARRDYYRFNGSLTTPPCSEGVVWLVMKDAVQVSAEQVEAFRHVMHHDNNRPVQPLNARVVLQ